MPPRTRRSSTAFASPPRAPICSTWEASRPGPARSPSPPRRSCAGRCPWSASWSAEPASRSPSTPPRRRWGAGRRCAVPDAHARHPAGHAAARRVRRSARGGARRTAGGAAARPRGGRSRGSHRARSRARIRKDRRAKPAPAAAVARSDAAGKAPAGRRIAQVVPGEVEREARGGAADRFDRRGDGGGPARRLPPPRPRRGGQQGGAGRGGRGAFVVQLTPKMRLASCSANARTPRLQPPDRSPMVLRLTDKPSEPARRLFGTDGIRGVANVHPMTGEMMLQLGRAVAYLIRNGPHRHRVVIGKDTRLSGYMLETALASGICSMGVDVLICGPLPTPAISQLTVSMRADAGAVISASHNPYQDNGIKFFSRDGFKLPDEIEMKIEELIAND